MGRKKTPLEFKMLSGHLKFELSTSLKKRMKHLNKAIELFHKKIAGKPPTKNLALSNIVKKTTVKGWPPLYYNRIRYTKQGRGRVTADTQ